MEARSTTNWESILNAGKSDDGNCDCQGAEKQQVDPYPAPEEENDSIATVLQEVIVE